MFWRLTPAEVSAVTAGRMACIKAAHDRSRMVAWEQANWIAYAMHDPKNLPPFKTLEAGQTEADEAVNDARVRGWFIAQAMRKH